MPDFAPCPTCKQYSHSIGEDAIAAAFNHFQTMVCENPMKDYPTGYAFSEATRNAAQVLMAGVRRARAEALEEAARLSDLRRQAILSAYEKAENKWRAAAWIAALDDIASSIRALSYSPPICAYTGEGDS